MKTTMTIAAGAIALTAASAALADPTGAAATLSETTDAVLLLMVVGGIAIGRRLHARKKPD